MTCREFIDYLRDHCAGELPPEQVALFHKHFAACPECVAYLHMYQQTVKLSKGALAALPGSSCKEAPEDLVRTIVISLQEEAKRPPS